jgi:hypothetical protein
MNRSGILALRLAIKRTAASRCDTSARSARDISFDGKKCGDVM